MSYRTLKLETTAEIATLTLYRPEKRNSLTTEMIEEIGSALYLPENRSWLVTCHCS